LLAELITCPLCSGEGELRRTEVLDRLGVKDFARVAQLSAEEAFRLLLEKHKQDEQNVWLRFESELSKRVSEITERQNSRIKELESVANLADEHKELEVQRIRVELENRLRSEQSQKDDLNRRVEDFFREVTQLRERNQELESEMAKAARVGKKEEADFAAEARCWAGISVSEKLPKNGDFILAYLDPSGSPLEPRILVDCKNKESGVNEGDIQKLIRDARERSTSVAVLVARDETQLRQFDRECRWGQKDGVWILRTTRQWLPRDLDVLRPVLERMRTEGPDFLRTNASLVEEVRRTFVDIDAIEKELGRASKAIHSVSALIAKHRERIQTLCDHASAHKMPSQPNVALGGRKGLAG